MKKIIVLLLMPILLACGDKNSPEIPPTPQPKPEPPTPPVVVDSPPTIRGFMVETAHRLHETTIKDMSAWGANAMRLRNLRTESCKKKFESKSASLSQHR